jgi:hypothetical protein
MKRLFASPWALFAAIALLRLPGFVFGILNIDESDFLVFGAGIWKGLLPYRDLVEIKPPLGYFTYALAFGFSLWPIRVLGVLWIFATALVLRGAARRWTGSEEAGWAAAWLSLLAGLVEVPSFGSESMMNLPVALALWLFVRGRRGRDLFLCGVCAGVATLYRHQAAIAPLALAIALLIRPEQTWGRTFSSVAAIGGGALLPWVAVGVFYAGLGQFPAFAEWTIWRNVSYVATGQAGSALARGAASIAICVVAASLPWALAVRETLRPRPDAVWRALALLLWLTWVSVALGGRFYEHYFLQFVPPLALLGAPLAADLARHWRELSRATRALTSVAVVAPLTVWLAFVWGKGIAGGYPEQEPRVRALAAWLRGHTAPTDTLFVWGHYTPIFTLARRLPGTRYVNTSVHIGNFDPAHVPDDFDPARNRSQRDVAATILDLDRRKPPWFVDTAPAGIHRWDRFPLSAFGELSRYRDEHYVEVARPGGAVVYVRRGLPTASARGGN